MEHTPSIGKRVAFFGGSFDPPHQGHLAVACAARAALALDKVLFAPVGTQPLKPLGSTASFEDRVAMTRLAIAGETGFAVSLLDAPKASSTPNYTLETLLAIRAKLPIDGTLFCLMGADSFLALSRWHRAAEIPFAANLVVASRPGQPLDDLKAALPRGLIMESASGADDAASEASGCEIRSWRLRNASGQTAPFYLLPALHVEISASMIRDLVRVREQAPGGDSAQTSGESASALSQQALPAAVLEYIRARGLYR